MLSQDLNTTAGIRVSYKNALHFSREYKRLFGASPMRAIARQREGARQHGGLKYHLLPDIKRVCGVKIRCRTISRPSSMRYNRFLLDEILIG